MHKPLYRTARGLVTAAVALVLAACAVGPDYHRPDVPTPDNFVSADASFSANDVEQDFWSAFDDAQLNDLIERALAANHDVRIAAARLREARALRGEARLDLAPTVTASASRVEGRASDRQAPVQSGIARDQEYYESGFDAIWELDFFGRVRRGVEASSAEV